MYLHKLKNQNVSQIYARTFLTKIYSGFFPFHIDKKCIRKICNYLLPTAGNGTNRCTIVLSVGGNDFARRIAIVKPT